MKIFSFVMYSVMLYLLLGLFVPNKIYGQTGQWISNPDYDDFRAIKKVMYIGALDTLGEANDTLFGAPIYIFNKYPGYTWIIKYKFISVGDCTTSVFMQRSDNTITGWATVATDTIRDKAVTVDDYIRYVYPVFRYYDYREYYRPVIVNEAGGRDSTWFEITFEGYPLVE